jgi:hypothetical protein
VKLPETYTRDIIKQGAVVNSGRARQPPINNRGKVFSVRPRDATVEQLFGEVFSMLSILRCYKHELRDISNKKNWSRAPDACLKPTQTGRLTD